MYEINNIIDKGRVIAFWSPVHRQGAVSTTAALLTSLMAKELEREGEGNKVLLMSNELYGADTAASYITLGDKSDGLTEIIDLARADNLKSINDIHNHTSTFHNIDILKNSERNTNVSDHISREIPTIFNVVRQGYKYTIVDTVCGTFKEATQAILRHCDAIVVCMPQDKHIIDDWIRKKQGVYTNEVEKKGTVIVSEQHWEYDHLSYGDIKKSLKCELSYISLNPVVHKAVSDYDIYGLVETELKAKNPDDIIYEIQEIYSKIQGYLNDIMNKEITEAEVIEEENKQKTKEYLENVSLFFGDVDESGGFISESDESKMGEFTDGYNNGFMLDDINEEDNKGEDSSESVGISEGNNKDAEDEDKEKEFNNSFFIDE